MESRDDIELVGGELLRAPQQGSIIFDLKDANGRTLSYWEHKNLVTYDAGILTARLFKNSLSPDPLRSNGLVMLAVGTGGVAIDTRQRKLETELARKAFLTATYVDGGGFPSVVPTNTVDFQIVFGPMEAVGFLNEMGLLYTASLNPLVTNPINNGPVGYDPTIDVTGKDILVNYYMWAGTPKPPLTILTITWRLLF